MLTSKNIYILLLKLNYSMKAESIKVQRDCSPVKQESETQKSDLIHLKSRDGESIWGTD